ncbi:MAG: protein-methionine-sulfoxide reductase catalytic subunit MsrP [Pseudomonadota bacterium]
MPITIKSSSDIKSSEITDPEVFHNRRRLLKGVTAALGTSILPPALYMNIANAEKLANVQSTDYQLEPEDQLSTLEQVSSYNNFYELGTGKGDPVKNASQLITEPWSVTVDGECDAPGKYTLEDILKPHAVEERIYRLRCVEAWSMVVPWNGFPLADLLKRFEPRSNAKYVKFETLFDPDNLTAQRRPILEWPYVEGLRMDEAMNPLTLMAVGVFGEKMPNQNGAPLRLVVPWKYGFKSIKSIVKISFQESQPTSSWTKASPREYGFYSNVNPTRHHPRWSQAQERRLDKSSEGGLLSLFTPKRKTLMFNGYEEQVAHLYDGMDLNEQY